MIVASIDIGTNTVLLLIAEIDLSNEKIIALQNEQRIPRIGKGLHPGKNIPEEKVNILFDILSDYSEIIKKYNCKKVLASATNALRIAANGIEIQKKILEKFNINVEIISGEREAAYSFLGASDSFKNDEPGIVIDIGGGSTEIILGKKLEIYFRKSFQIGVVSGTELYLQNDPPTSTEKEKFINKLQNIFEKIKLLKNESSQAVAIAGTPTTLACLKYHLTEFNEKKIEGSILKRDELAGQIETLSVLSGKEILDRHKSVVKGREDILLAGAIILHQISELLELDEIIVSTKGIRYGAIKYNFENLKDEYSEE
jgi:exopolyphosphatase / guanosine-5'-triphosphate,3'-diphosphate pyrophosphatase